MKRLHNIGRLFTATGAGVVERASVIASEKIAWAGVEGKEPRELMEKVTDEHDCGAGLVTPGLIDAHTHPLYAGDRMAEVAMRSAGATYTEVAKAGGGIRASVWATRSASAEALEAAAAQRLRKWFAGGATTVEAKTGYHLEREGELKATMILSRLSARTDLPRIEVTFLAAHSVPPERPRQRDAYAKEVASWCRDAKEAGARFCDVFCDEGYFTVAQSRRVLKAGMAAGLIPRIHADEIARTGGAKLAAELHAASADHLLRAERKDAVALAKAGVVATLAPVTALSMGKLPPVRELLEAGTVIALGTDHNPGTSGVTSMSLVVALAVSVLKLSVERALIAGTIGGAYSLSLADRGSISTGLAADLVLWEADHEGAFAWAYGLRPRSVWRAGALVAS